MAAPVATVAGTQSSVSGATSTITLTAAIAAGQTIVVLGGNRNARTISGITDTAGNTYTVPAATNVAAAMAAGAGYCLDPLALGIGDTITVTWSATVSGPACCAVDLGVLCELDASSLDEQADNGDVSLSSTASADSRMLAIVAYGNSTNYSTPSGWDATLYEGTFSSRRIEAYSEERTSSGTVTLSQSVGQDYAAVMLGFTAAAGGSVTGTGAGTAAAQTGSGTGERTVTGTGAGQAAAQIAAGTGGAASTITGSGDGVAPAQTGAGVGLRLITGTGTGASATQAGAGSGLRLITGDGAGSAAPQTAAGLGLRLVAGTGAGTATAQIGAGTGERTVTGSGAGTAPAQTGSGAQGAASITGSGAGTAPAQIATGAGLRLVAATGAGSAAPQTAEGLGLRTIKGSGAGLAAAQTGSGAQGGTGSGTTVSVAMTYPAPPTARAIYPDAAEAAMTYPSVPTVPLKWIAA